MQYAQLNEAGTDGLQITTSGNVEWDATHFCPAHTLTEAEAEQFRVVPLIETEAPVIDPITQSVMRDGIEFISAQWQYKWRIDDLSVEQVAANQAAALAATQAAYTAALEAMYDTKAQERQYDSRLTCALRAGYPGPFQPEGTAFAVWMDTCNAYAYQVMTEVLMGTRPMPTAEDLIAELPALVWPA